MTDDSMTVLDACAFHEWPDSTALLPYMDEGWHELVAPTRAGFAVNTHGSRLMTDPRRGGATPLFEPAPTSVELPGSSFDAFAEEVLERDGRERIVLGYDIGLASTTFVHRYFSRDIARAANDWTHAEWLSRDERLYGMVLVSTSMPLDAAAEIRRAGQNERMVAVALGCNALSCGFGEPVYHPILEAAAELDLPIVLQGGSDNAADIPSPPVGGGVPTTYGEYRAHIQHALSMHAASMISEGVFRRWPGLKVLMVGGGAAWIPPWLWRMDLFWKSAGSAIPWVDRRPSDCFLEHFRVSTHMLESPRDTGRLAQALRVFDGIEQILMYTSCYPDSDWERPESIAARLPGSWTKRVFRENALEFFRWRSFPAQKPVRDPVTHAGAA